MTTLLNQITLEAVKSSNDFERTATYGVIAIMLLATLFVTGELARAYEGQPRKLWIESSQGALLTLCVATGLVVAIRLLRFIAFL